MLSPRMSIRNTLRRRMAPARFAADFGAYDTMSAPPETLIQPDGSYAAGWYDAPPARLELDRNTQAGWRRLHRWFFVHFDSDELFVGANLVDLRLGGNAGIIVLDKRTGKFTVAGDTGLLWNNGVHISEDCRRFEDRRTGSMMAMSADDRTLEFDLDVDGVRFTGRASELFAQPFVQSTRLGASLGTLQMWGNLRLDEGSVTIKGRRVDLQPGLYGAYDRSLGHRRLLENWNWVASCGEATRDRDGQTLPFALHAARDRADARPQVDGSKYLLWLGDRFLKLPDLRFEYTYTDAAALETTRWRIVSPRSKDQEAWVDLSFTPRFHRRDAHRVPLVLNVDHSQYFGSLNGTVRLDGETFTVRDVFATTEDSRMTV